MSIAAPSAAVLNGGKPWRKTSQVLAPARYQETPIGQYNVLARFPIGTGKIAVGFEALADLMMGHQRVMIDGYGGTFWEHLRAQLEAVFAARRVHVAWHHVNEGLRSPEEIEALVAPFLGGDDPLFGTKFTGKLADFYDVARLQNLTPAADADLTVVYGCGAALCGWDGLLVYVDVPKNEIQFRARAGSVTNLGCSQPADHKMMYKRFYFVDWVALNRHRADIQPRLDVVVDLQRPDEPTLIRGTDFRAALDLIAHNYFRVRPWFEPGAWGGQWLKQHIPHLPRDVPNYAWSFELIVPENGIVLESDGYLLEAAFDVLMFHAHRAVLGKQADRFGYDFPIRFDFLDTFDGGNLSVQCHPRPEYARRHFGEPFTQDETYYILDCKPGAQVYLGFRETTDPAAFREALETSFRTSTPIDVEQYITTVPAHRGDLFLIPNGTIHCSGVNTLVLEISATPYIFTFKMYDWMRLDLDGKPRPLNIERAFENLYFDRKGQQVQEQLISHPYVLEAGSGWQVVHLPTHREHFYDVHRLEFDTEIEVDTQDSCHILNLVEGQSIRLETAAGLQQRFNFAETFVVPAACGHYRLINEGPQPVKVIKGFLKP